MRIPDGQQRRDEIMHWLQTNGVAETADRIVDSVHSEVPWAGRGPWLCYETIEGPPGPDGPTKRMHRVEMRVPFSEAMRDYREQYRPATPVAEFLLARIAEDEAVAREAADGPTDGRWAFDDGYPVEKRGGFEVARHSGVRGAKFHLGQSGNDAWRNPEMIHVARFNPARVLAECDAKRRIVELAPWADNAHQAALRHPAGNAILHWLALPYADHPDYDEAWQP